MTVVLRCSRLLGLACIVLATSVVVAASGDRISKPGSSKQAVAQRSTQLTSGPAPSNQSSSPFSDLTLFSFGSGFAIFVALLGWSDQIRGLTKETYELQGEFLRQYDLTRAELQPVIRAETPDEQLQAFTPLMQSNKLGADAVRLLPLLRSWRKQHIRVARMQSWKYGLTVALSLAFFVAGVLLSLGCPEIATILVPAALLAVILGLIIWTNLLEHRLHATLNEMMERI